MTGEDLGFADTLSVHLRGNINGIDSYTSGTLQRAVHQAAAGIAKWQRKPARVLSDITSVDRAMAPLPQPTVVGNMIVFRVPAEPSMLPGFQVSTAAAPALRELVDTLPREATDHDSLQGIFGAHPLIRQAVQAISKAAAVVPDGIALELSVPGEGNNVRRSVLTKATATEIDDYLATPEMSARTETVHGYLDGFRATRRVFYLIINKGQPDEREIAGAVSGDLINEVRDLTGHNVTARVVVTVRKRRNEKRTRPSYELNSVVASSARGDQPTLTD
jgi:hypothetical protein